MIAGPWEEEIGTVGHYFNGLHVAAIHIEYGHMQVGDRLHIRGHTTDMEETILEMQVNNTEIRECGVGAYVGVPVHEKVREHDHVYIIHQ